MMSQDATIVTPNNRLSMQLLEDYLAESRHTLVEKPNCFSYQAFLQQSYKNICHQSPPSMIHPLLLNANQQRFLWQKILSEDSQQIANQGLITEVQESWSRCLLWNIDNQDARFASTAQTRQLQQWWRCMQESLDNLHAITNDQLVPWILKQSDFIAPKTMIWMCFDDYTPQQEALQIFLERLGTTHYHAELIDDAVSSLIYSAEDTIDEYKQLTSWLLDNLAEGKQRIGVIVPDLQQQAKNLNRFLQQKLPKGSFNLSLGQSLAEFTLIAHAFCWLALDGKQLTQHQANLLLRSPFLIQAQGEMLARAQLLQDSRCLQEMIIDQTLFLKELQETSPLLASALDTLTIYPQSASPQGWAALFQKRLSHLGFPGEYSLNSANYQCYQRFLLLIDEFKQLNVLINDLDFGQALAAFSNLAKTTIFQPKKKSAAPVHIMGLLESAGSQFDCLWVTGLTDECLPKKTRLSAFIPIELQREKQMPYANLDRELLLAKKTLARLKNAGKIGIFSYPRLSKDKPNLPSPLLAELLPYKARDSKDAIHFSVKLVTFDDHYHQPVLEQEKLSGGTLILANQAKCPFRAFATHRLHAKTALPISDGPSAMERGQIVHKVMEVLWQLLKNQQTLQAMEPSLLDEIIDKAIAKAIEPYKRLRPHSFSPLIQTVESKRLKRLVNAVLTWEKQRPAFVVEALEQSFNLNLAGLDFQVRIDRLDSLSADEKWVIDYKSALPQSTPWHEERPTEPQLLLYALLNENINTILFAELKNGQFQCKGFSGDSHDIPGIQTVKKDNSWESYRQQWRQQLTDLAQEFTSGYCPPKPVKASVCLQCEFQNLCRFSIKGEDN